MAVKPYAFSNFGTNPCPCGFKKNETDYPYRRFGGSFAFSVVR